MKIGKKETLVGVIFALFIAIFINYNAIERMIDTTREFNENMVPQLISSMVWVFVISLLYYFLYVLILNVLSRKSRKGVVTILAIFVISMVVTYLLIEIYPYFRDLVIPDSLPHRPQANPPARMVGVYRGFSSLHFIHLLVAILNLLFVYIQRLLYRNQEVEMRNEQLQLESVRSQHSALIQQINPHFFFNSLGSLRYIILKGDGDDAVDFLDNLTTIFRKTLKLSDNTLHTLREEVELTISYIHIIEKRFAGKIFVEFDIAESAESYMLSPLSILTLMENIVKHNTVSAKNPVRVKIYTTPEEEIVVENNIVPKFDDVESNGIGLINLNKQYMLLTGRGVVVTSKDNIFQVRLPLIKERL